MTKVDPEIALNIRALSTKSEALDGFRERIIWQSNRVEPLVQVVHLFRISKKGKVKDWGYVEIRISNDASFDVDGWMRWQEDFAKAGYKAFYAQHMVEREIFPEYLPTAVAV